MWSSNSLRFNVFEPVVLAIRNRDIACGSVDSFIIDPAGFIGRLEGRGKTLEAES
jgi:hypothetical protein